KILLGIDSWDLAALTFRDNFETAVIEKRELRPNSRPSVREGEIDLLVASPECTNHSPAKGSKPRSEVSRATSSYVLNFAGILRPRWIIIENVIQLREWRGYSRLINGIRDLGYFIQPQVLDAVDFGVPQKRRRLFIICDREKPPPIIKK